MADRTNATLPLSQMVTNSGRIDQRSCRNLAAFFIALLLVSCGDGGGGGAGPSAPISATANITAQNLTVGIPMASFSPLTASGGAPPYTYSYTGTLPAGLNFNNSTGVVSGTPTAAYPTANLVFSVTDAGNVTASTTSTVSFTVAAASPNIIATANTTAQSLTVGTAMAAFSPLTATGGATPYTYSYVGALPAGVSLNTTTGIVSGTPAAAYSTANVVFSVHDANNVVASTTSTVSFTVGAASASISAIANQTAQNLTVGNPMASFSPLTASGGAIPYSYSYTGTLPPGLSLNFSTGAVTGTPTAAYATANVVFSVRDANNVTASTTSTVSFTVVAPVVSRLNDTGVTSGQCYKAGAFTFSDTLVDCGSPEAIALSNAQDGMTGRDVNPATNSNTNGKLGFSFTAVTGGCVRDNVTGLTWEVKTTDGGLRDWAKTYTNYGDGRTGDASAYPAAVNSTNLCGYSDWRLPTVDELLSIVDFGVADFSATIDTTWFPNTQTGHFWTSSPHVESPTFYAWVVHFNFGWDHYFYGRDGSLYVRVVRGGL